MILTNCSFSNIVEPPFNIAGDGLIVGRDLRFQNTPTPFVNDGVNLDLKGVTYTAPTRYQERKRRQQQRKNQNQRG
jgi:hypothetical protein